MPQRLLRWRALRRGPTRSERWLTRYALTLLGNEWHTRRWSDEDGSRGMTRRRVPASLDALAARTKVSPGGQVVIKANPLCTGSLARSFSCMTSLGWGISYTFGRFTTIIITTSVLPDEVTQLGKGDGTCMQPLARLDTLPRDPLVSICLEREQTSGFLVPYELVHDRVGEQSLKRGEDGDKTPRFGRWKP